jgi:DNA-binding NarL/FixJ family response regulator
MVLSPEPCDDPAKHITVALGRFDALTSRGLVQILREDRHVLIIGTCLDEAALERALARHVLRVVILDETSAEPTVLERLRVAQPGVAIIVMVHQPTVAYGMRLLASGASCLSKRLSGAEILGAVHLAADGGRVFTDVNGHRVERSIPATASSLTPRETEVLEYLSMGLSNAEVAHALQLSVETIRTHSAHIRAKLGVRNKRELIGLKLPTHAARDSQ